MKKVGEIEDILETLDNVDDRLVRMQSVVDSHAEAVRVLKEQFLTKAAEGTVAFYLEKIAKGLQREVGDPPHDVNS
jgi:hypothetical protein